MPDESLPARRKAVIELGRSTLPSAIRGHSLGERLPRTVGPVVQPASHLRRSTGVGQSTDISGVVEHPAGGHQPSHGERTGETCRIPA
jgi:hypothetical protein